MAGRESIDTIVRVDNNGPLEGHGAADRTSSESMVKKGKFMAVGESVGLNTNGYSPNKKTGTSSGVDF